MIKIQPVVLAGGTGSRLWPLSREMYPKQLLELIDDTSLLQTTMLRVAAIPDALPPIIVVGEEHRFTARSQIEELELFDDFKILLESQGRNTAPAICGAAEYCNHCGIDDVVILMLPADHIVRNIEAFLDAVQRAAELARNGSIVTFGIEPTHSETGYGYIERGEGNSVASFTEKPSLAMANEYLESGKHFWNSGMFAFSPVVFAEEMKKHAPQIFECMDKAVAQGSEDERFFRFDPEMMAICPTNSIDYALMEKTEKVALVVADLGWSDIGSWPSLWRVLDKDDDGNVCQGDVLLEDTKNCFVRSEGMLVAAVGMQDALIIQTSDVVLVASMPRSHKVKEIVTNLQSNKRKEYSFHRTVHRPWGNYTVLEEQERYQMKRIVVHPGAKLSLQMHHHRYEHWVVVKGTARITNGDSVKLLHENESTYIPAGTVHRLENPGVIALELIEVQIGPYLGEDDIVRLEDIYGREKE